MDQRAVSRRLESVCGTTGVPPSAATSLWQRFRVEQRDNMSYFHVLKLAFPEPDHGQKTHEKSRR
jgi:hypothetical protein